MNKRWGNVQITAHIRNLLNREGLDWEICEKIGEEVQELLDSTETLSDDKGNQWDFNYAHEENVRRMKK